MSKYADISRQILELDGPLLGSELVDRLMQQTGIGSTNARQVLLRLRRDDTVKTTDPVRLRANQLIYFLPGQKISAKLAEVSLDHSKRLHRLYQAFANQNGFLLWPEFAKLSAASVSRETSANYKTAEEVFDELLRSGLVFPMREYKGVNVVVASQLWVPHNSGDNDAYIYKRVEDWLLERRLLADLTKWMERLNLAGWSATHVHSFDEEDQGVNGFYWDAHGFSYLWGLYSTDDVTTSPLSPPQRKKGSLILVESVLMRDLQVYDMAGFIARVHVQNARLRGAGQFRIIPVCFAGRITPEALALARAKGILIVTASEVFGRRFFEMLDTIRKIDQRNVELESLVNVLSTAKDSGQDGKFGSIKGYLFNLLVASIFTHFGWSVRVGEKFENSAREKCECDIVVTSEVEGIKIICECKGYERDKLVPLGMANQADTVRKFYERTANIVQEASGKRVLPIFITSGGFSADAIAYLEKRNNGKKTQGMLEALGRFPGQIYYDYSSLMELLKKQPHELSSFRQILREFFSESSPT